MAEREPHYKIKFNFTPYKKQQMIIDYINGDKKNPDGEPYRFILAILGRQSGKSWLARVTLLHKAINERKRCMWVSPNYPSSRTHWKELVNLLTKSKIPIKKITQAAKEIDFYGGGSITVRTAMAPDTMRGVSMDYVVLDEAAFYDYGEYVWYSIVLPTITATKGSIFIPTTPNGKNWVYDLYNLGQDEKEKYYISFRWASSESPYQDKEMLKDIKKNTPRKQWLEEYEAEFLSDGNSAFSGIDEAATAQFITQPEPHHSYVMGVDVGSNIDDTCITIIDKYERKQVYGEAFNDLGTISTIKRIIELMELWNPEVTVVEKNGVGDALLKLLKQALNDPNYMSILPFDGVNSFSVGQHVVRAIHMSNEIKRNYVERLITDIEYSRFAILNRETTYGKLQFSQMGNYIKARTPAGMYTYQASGANHDDTVAALYLAYSAVPVYTITPTARVVSSENREKQPSPFRGGLSARHHRIKRVRD